VLFFKGGVCLDTFIEYIVKRKMKAMDYLIIAGTVVLIVALAFICLFFNSKLMGIPFILFVFALWGAYTIISLRNVEFEYILTNNELDIDKIMAKKSRKRMMTINFKEIERCAGVNNPEFKHILDNTGGIFKTEYFEGDMGSGNVYFVDFSKDGNKIRAFFEPNERILNELKKINPRCIHLNPEEK